MEDIRRIIVILTGFALAIFLSILVMIKGWGLEPKSYFWIIVVGFFGQVLAQIIIKFGSDKE